MINLIVILQLLTIIGSRGNVYVLGEAYAFGVVWSFAFKGLAVLVLRFKDRSQREWKVPLNIRLDGNEIPLGLGIIAALLFSVAGINLITKQVATVSGVAFTPYPTAPGDVVFFDSYVPHQSGPNLSPEARRVLYVTYNRLSEGDHRARYYADKRKSYPPDCEREPGTQYVYRV